MIKKLKLPIILCVGKHPVIGEDGKPIVLEEKSITLYINKIIKTDYEQIVY